MPDGEIEMHEIDDLIEVLHDAWLDGGRDAGRVAADLARTLGVAQVGTDEDGVWLRLDVAGCSYRMRWVASGGRPFPGRWMGERLVSRALWKSLMGGEPVVPTDHEDRHLGATWSEAWMFTQRLAAHVPVLQPRLPSVVEGGRALRSAGAGEWCRDQAERPGMEAVDPASRSNRPALLRRGAYRAFLRLEDSMIAVHNSGSNDAWPGAGLRLAAGPALRGEATVVERARAYHELLLDRLVDPRLVVAWVNGVLANQRSPTPALLDASMASEPHPLAAALYDVGKAAAPLAWTRFALLEILVRLEVRTLPFSDELEAMVSGWSFDHAELPDYLITEEFGPFLNYLRREAG